MILGPPTSPRRTTQDRAIVPMINVVFLLLIFFLMSATLAPPQPLDVTPPTAEGAETDPQPGTLHVDASGQLAYSDVRGQDVWGPLARHDGPLPLRVDATYPATDLASLLTDLAELGIVETRLLTVRP